MAFAAVIRVVSAEAVGKGVVSFLRFVFCRISRGRIGGLDGGLDDGLDDVLDDVLDGGLNGGPSGGPSGVPGGQVAGCGLRGYLGEWRSGRETRISLAGRGLSLCLREALLFCQPRGFRA